MVDDNNSRREVLGKVVWTTLLDQGLIYMEGNSRFEAIRSRWPHGDGDDENDDGIGNIYVMI